MKSATELDAADPLAPFRDLFVHSSAESDLIYLDGNSLGRQPAAVSEILQRVVHQEWAERLIRGWNEGWLDISRSVGDLIGQLLGAQPGEVILAENTSACLYKVATAALRARPEGKKLVTDSENFPSDIQILESACVSAGANCRVEVVDTTISPDPMTSLLSAIDDSTALVSLSHVSYKLGWRWNLEEVNKAAERCDALVLWDFSHSVGAVPINVAATGVNLAVGCTYKYLNGGPGAPAFIYVRSDQTQLANPVAGWFGSTAPFSFDPSSPPAPGVERFLTGTPHVVSAALIEPGVAMLLEAGMDRVYEKSVALSERFIHLCDERLADAGFEVRSPRNPDQRGSHVALFHPYAQAVGLALIHEQSVIPDFRPPDLLRFGFAPMYTSFTDIDNTVDHIIEVVENGGVDRWRDETPLVP
ncbi:MAG: aminotransferase class V-fold PLP-dependent enzyme [Acidimicrobiales bacterium]|nr:aminotransferase class V-fold PLP-dependent enzyme [Acidimicrobiales bacterium]